MVLSPSAVDSFWATTAGDPHFRGAVGGLLHRQLTAATEFRVDKHEALRLRVIGGVERPQAEDFFQPRSFAPKLRLNRNGRWTLRRGSGAGRSSIFRGRDWQRVAVVPFYEAPGQICAFSLWDADQGRTSDEPWRQFTPLDSFPWFAPAPNYGRWAKDLIHRPIRASRRRPAEAGLAMLNTVFARHAPLFENDVFVFVDLVPALDLQMRFVQSSVDPLPIVVARDDERFRTCAAWQHLPQGKHVTLVAESAQPWIFRQAQMANANVCLDTRLARHVRQSYPPAGLLLEYRKRAESWQRALQRQLRNRTPNEAATFLEQVELPPATWAQFLNDSHPLVLDRLRASSQAQQFAPRAFVHGEVVLEQEDSWVLRRTGQQICSVIRIEQIFCKLDGTRFLSGSVPINGTPHRFLIPQNQAEQLGLPNALRKHFRDKELVLPCKHGWSRKILELALKINPPKVVENADVVGWQSGKTFQWPEFGFDRRGFRPELRAPLAYQDSPAKNLKPPSTLSRQDVRPITLDWPIVHRFWAVVISAAYNVLAPAIHRPPIGIVLAGRDAPRLADAIADVFGCRQVDAPARGHAKQAYSELNAVLADARWPLVVRPRVKTLGPLRKILTELRPANCFVPVTDILAAPIARANGWHVIPCEEAGETIELVDRFGADVVLNYLKHVTSRHFDYRAIGDDSLDNISSDMARWFGDVFRGRPAVHGARSTIWTPTKATEELAQQVDYVAELEALVINREDPLIPGSEAVGLAGASAV